MRRYTLLCCVRADGAIAFGEEVDWRRAEENKQRRKQGGGQVRPSEKFHVPVSGTSVMSQTIRTQVEKDPGWQDEAKVRGRRCRVVCVCVCMCVCVCGWVLRGGVTVMWGG